MKPRLARAALAFTLSVIALAPARPVVAAEAKKTLTQQRIDALKQLIPLRKVTVGPDDQYASAVDINSKQIAFTHKADLVPHLRIQDLTTGDASDLLSPTADSQEAVFSPSGRLAFTYYRRNARGDVCWTVKPIRATRQLQESDFSCLPRGESDSDTERATPFWASEDEIGFVSRSIANQQRTIRVRNLKSGTERTLAQGRVWAPAMRPGGRYIVFNEVVEIGGETKRTLALMDAQSGRKTSIEFDLPGFPGFPAIAADETAVYFSHYFNDTNQDNAIDGGDNAVIFRASIATILAKNGKGIFPEQLTSVETSCSYPRPAADRLFATCAFEGSLDVYSLPLTGAVPEEWNQATLESALRTSRSYQDRILILNAVRYRSPNSAVTVDETLFHNHVLADDVSAALYYLKILEARATGLNTQGRGKGFFALWGLYLRARELKQAQPSEEPSRELTRALVALEAQAAKITGEDALRATVQGHLRAFLNQSRETQARFKTAESHFSTAKSVRPLDRALWFELAVRALDTEASGPAARALDSVFATMVAAPELDQESRVFYAFQFLKQVEASEKSIPARRARIASFLKNGAGSVAPLLKSEDASLRIIEATDPKLKFPVYQELDRLMSETRGDYFLRKALYVRSILNLVAAAEFDFMTLVATTWLKYTAMDDTEFIHARQVFSYSSLDQGYDNWAKGKLQFAENYFFQSVALTDDLESHYGFVKTMILRNERKDLTARYANFVKREMVGENMKFVEALLILTDKGDEGVDDALDILASMGQDRESPVRRLLMGYCYLMQLMRGSDALDFDSALLEKAHHELMLAYDVGRSNERIASAALINLGLLHARVQNHALSARFFGLRKRYGFLDSGEQARFSALYARALFLSRQPDAAFDELAAIPQALLSPPLQERAALYASASGKFAEAAKRYEDFFKAAGPLDAMNATKTNLSFGYVLFKLNKPVEATARLKAALQAAEGLSSISKGKARVVNFDPKRIQAIALGLLAQTAPPAERKSVLERRLRLLDSASDLVDDPPAAQIQTRLQLASVQGPSEAAQAKQILLEAVSKASSLGESKGFLSQVTYQAALASISHAIKHRGLYSPKESAGPRALGEACVRAYDALSSSTPFVDAQRTKLQILVSALSGQASGIDIALAVPAAGRVKSGAPEAWKEIDALVRALRP